MSAKLSNFKSFVSTKNFLGNKDQTDYDLELPINCVSSKLRKRNILPFPLHGNRATKCFNIVHSDI